MSSSSCGSCMTCQSQVCTCSQSCQLVGGSCSSGVLAGYGMGAALLQPGMPCGSGAVGMCGSGSMCVSGSCSCQSGYMMQGGSCTMQGGMSYYGQTCSGLSQCGNSFMCQAGTCVCPTGYSWGGSSCVVGGMASNLLGYGGLGLYSGMLKNFI